MFILSQVEAYGDSIAMRVVRRFEVSRQAAHRHLKLLVDDGLLQANGKTRNRVYELVPLIKKRWKYTLTAAPEEHIVWEKHLEPLLSSLPRNVLQAFQFGFTEMFNNVLDHSGATSVTVHLLQTHETTQILITDDGIGIFRKIQLALGLEDERHSILQLVKGKFTTDPTRHSGEGIFWVSKMFKPFLIWSDQIAYKPGAGVDLIARNEQDTHRGTAVSMTISNRSRLKMADVFSKYTSGEERDFSRTVVPVRLAQFGTSNLISRSQAKRVVAGLDLFKEVWLDFAKVDLIGQGFADEIFRVFQRANPGIRLIVLNAVPDVQGMVDHVRKGSPLRSASEKGT